MIQSLVEIRRSMAAKPKSHNSFSDSDPRRLKPFSLDQQKKRAKELLRDARDEKYDALQRVAAYLPPDIESSTVKLHHAQLVVARENHFVSWAKFQAYIEAARIERETVNSGQPSALDDENTLHIRCGSDIMQGLAVAGFKGDFLVFADPIVDGPLPATDSLDEYLDIRTSFIAQTGWATKSEATERFRDEYDSLIRAKTYRRVMIWCEHDPWDMTNLARILSLLGQPSYKPRELNLVVVDRFPGVKKFVGIGQLPADALRTIWKWFAPVTNDQLKLGQSIWAGLTSSDPTQLDAIIRSGTRVLPTMAPALKRFLQELPSFHNGLSLTEELTLKILQEEGPIDAAKLFYDRYTTGYEPMPFFGDSSYWIRLYGLADASTPAVQIRKNGEKRIDWLVSLTDFGMALLQGESDWLAQNPVDRWLGGVHIRSGKQNWRWDHQRDAPSLPDLNARSAPSPFSG